jgi:hypothetical protein
MLRPDSSAIHNIEAMMVRMNRDQKGLGPFLSLFLSSRVDLSNSISFSLFGYFVCGASPLKLYAPAHDDENNEYYEGDDDGLSRPDSKRSTGPAGVGDKSAQIHLFLLFARAIFIFLFLDIRTNCS